MILLDTNALIRVVLGLKLRNIAIDRVVEAEATGTTAVSAAVAWELCLLETTGRTSKLIAQDGARFFRSAVRGAALQVIPIDGDIAIESRRLPGLFHKDPADRFIVATARLRRMTILTDDRAILDYAAQGHVEALRC